MMKPTGPTSVRRRRPARGKGFTLIEMLIVAALIVIFSTIAIFSMQELMVSSRRKAAIADLRTIAHTMSAAHMDLAFFPKIGYLAYPLDGADPIGGVRRGTASNPELPPRFDALGYLGATNPISRRVINNWRGPYLPDSSSRSVLSYSPYAYTSTMRIPNPDAGEDDEIMAWPCDPWGSPYVAYLLHTEEGVREDWIVEPTEKANYKAIVVSYGRNMIPGGSDDIGAITQEIRQKAEYYKLYKVDPTGQADFVMLTDAEFLEDSSKRLNALYNDWGYGADVGADVPGILDEATDDRPGSDDLVVPIP